MDGRDGRAEGGGRDDAVWGIVMLNRDGSTTRFPWNIGRFPVFLSVPFSVLIVSQNNCRPVLTAVRGIVL